MDGFSPQCIECTKLYEKKKHAQNPEVNRSRVHKWYINNSKQKCLYVANWLQENKDHKREYLKEYRIKNPKKFQQYTKKRDLYKYHNISNEEWEACKKYFNYECAYCGKTLKENKREFNQDLCKDHFVNNGNNNLTNCIPACKNCNSKKSTKTIEDWYNPDNPTFSYERMNKILQWLTEDCFLYIEKPEDTAN